MPDYKKGLNWKTSHKSAITNPDSLAADALVKKTMLLTVIPLSVQLALLFILVIFNPCKNSEGCSNNYVILIGIFVFPISIIILLLTSIIQTANDTDFLRGLKINIYLASTPMIIAFITLIILSFRG